MRMLLANISIIFLSLLFRLLIGNHSYSGAGKSPMFGDYEAQRHWMEVTVNLPAKDWYVNGTDNDLQYWGLDYPPLTAYHSWALGKVAQFLNPKWVELYESRGFEDVFHKSFMRFSVIISDLLIYIPAVFAIFELYSDPFRNKDTFERWKILSCLLSPSLLLIDHGHFQYNCVALGLFLWSVISFSKQNDLIGSMAFCMALNFKQMSLYYSLPIFCYLLQRCYRQKTFGQSFLKLFMIGMTVIFSFAVMWAPFLSDPELALQVVRRIFPVDRGIYEDKVASFWYCISVVFKIKEYFSQDYLALASAALTLFLSFPYCVSLLTNGSIQSLKYCLVNVSLVFFLFSYHVHEKTILFVCAALMLLANEETMAMVWFELIATFSLMPLLMKDGLLLPFAVLPFLYFILNFPTILAFLRRQNNVFRFVFSLSISISIIICFVALTLPPPSRLPHLHILINCVYSFVHFCLFLVYFTSRQYLQSYLARLSTEPTDVSSKKND